jgi:hypothetical protein
VVTNPPDDPLHHPEKLNKVAVTEGGLASTTERFLPECAESDVEQPCVAYLAVAVMIVGAFGAEVSVALY